jgi:hypothetical protein
VREGDGGDRSERSPTDSEFLRRLELARDDFARVTGAPFENFYCPILFRDEQATLCRGHIVSQAFPNSPRRWTVQRRDVDSFFGWAFEEEFLGIQYLSGRLSPENVLVDRSLSRRLRPKIALQGEEVQHYARQTKHAVPASFSRLDLETSGGTASFVLKIAPEELIPFTGSPGGLEIVLERDLRLAALVSLLKAAHLTLFDLLGYRYVLSSGGWLLGKSILGVFVSSAQADDDRNWVHARARGHFADFVHLVRPVLRDAADPRLGRSTLEDGIVWICGNEPHVPWALMVFVRTEGQRHAVLCPCFERHVEVNRFLSFLSDGERTISCWPAKLESGAWHVDPRRLNVEWPRQGCALD